VGGPALNYYVQLGAFADDERALALFDEVRAAGVDARVVRVEGSRFTHVRVGRFGQREDAVELLDELTARGINAALVRDDRPEVAVRD
jgi:cell division septation protein DedD